MDNVLDFLADNYMYFVIISFVLLVALVGLVAKESSRKNKDKKTLASAGNISQQASSSTEFDSPIGIDNMMSGGTLEIPDNSTESVNSENNPLEIQGQSDDPSLVIPDSGVSEENNVQPGEPTLVIPDSNSELETKSDEPTLIIPDSSVEQDSVQSDEPTLIIPDPSLDQNTVQQNMVTQDPNMGVQQAYVVQDPNGMMYTQGQQMMPDQGLYQQQVVYAQPMQQPMGFVQGVPVQQTYVIQDPNGMMYTQGQPVATMVMPNTVDNGQMNQGMQNNNQQM